MQAQLTDKRGIITSTDWRRLVIFGVAALGLSLMGIMFGGVLVKQSAPPTTQQSAESEYIHDQLTVRFASGANVHTAEAAQATLAAFSMPSIRAVAPIFDTQPGVPNRDEKITMGMDRDYRVTLEQGADVLAVANSLKGDQRIEHAAPVPLPVRTLVPNDPYYTPNTPPDYRQWNHVNTHDEEAWNLSTGDPDIVISIMDTGVDFTHPDLAGNIWQNLGEDFDQDGRTIEFNGTTWVLDPGDLADGGVDGDQNGHINDLIGWNFASESNNVIGDPAHGTPVGGAAVARGNNALGVAGVCWTCKLMTTINGGLYSDGIIYATENGADVISLSLTLGNNDAPYVHEAIQYAVQHGVVVVAGIGNGDGNVRIYPGSYDEVISVAGNWRDDERAGGDAPLVGSDWGPQADVSAPFETWSTAGSGSGYAFAGGTSISGPIVAGIVGLMKAHTPSLRRFNAQGQEQPAVVDKIASAIRGAVDPIYVPAGTTARYIGTGRVNALKALSYTGYPLAHLDPSLDEIVFGPWMTLAITGTAAGANFQNYTVDYGLGVYPASWTSLGTYTTPVTNGSLAQLIANGLVDGSTYTFRVRVRDTLGNETQDMTLLQYQQSGGGGSGCGSPGCELE